MINIGIIGAGQCNSSTGGIAYRAGFAVARTGAVLYCGGLEGVMEHASRGARDAGGTVIGILPGDDRTGANPYLSYSIPTGFGEARNSIVVKCSDVLIAISGSYGTLSEIAYALKWGKPVAGIGTFRITDENGQSAPIRYFDSPEEAVEWAAEIASNRSKIRSNREEAK
ncbi:MAG: TIGR00725 family protein [Firmicutes bacterium]|nr:TIGR00725 family protein [Bacillota bacterium]